MGLRVGSTLLANTVIGAAATYPFGMLASIGCDIEVNAVVNSTAATAAAATAATLTSQGLTLTAVLNATGSNGAAGNSITLTITGGGTAGSEVVSVVGSAISVQVQSGVSTVTQVRTAMQASTPCTALVTTTGTSSSTVATAAAVALTGGASSGFDCVDSAVNSTAHGFFTGQVVQVTKSGAAFPTGLSASTNYYVLSLGANQFQLFTSLAYALAASIGAVYAPLSATGLVLITADATAGSTITFTPTSVSGCSYKLQKSNSYDPQFNTGATWIPLVSGETNSVVTNTITTTGTTSASAHQLYSKWAAITFAIAAGTVQIKVYSSVKAV